MNKKQLLERLAKLEAENTTLKHDHAFGGLTRPGLEVEFERRKSEAKYSIFIDLDGIHALNEANHGNYDVVDGMIRKALTLRYDDLVFFGRWKSGDEVVFIVNANPDGFIARLLENLKAQGLSATCAAVKIENGDLTSAVQAGIKQVSAIKASRPNKTR